MASRIHSLKVEIFKMPESVEPANVTTAGNYILTAHLLRSLTKLDKIGGIHGDLAKSWFCSEDKKTWTIELGTAKFSNGENITAGDVVASINRQIKLRTGVHFPFEEIKQVKELTTNSLRIDLSSARTNFIYDLSKPEFGVLYKADYASPKGKGKFSVTSGPYYLSSQNGTSYHLVRNKHYTVDALNDLDVLMESSAGNESANRLGAGKIDFFSSQETLTKEEHSKLLNSDVKVNTVKPHVGFTFWVSINPDSPVFQNLANRAKLQTILRDFRPKAVDGIFWEKAEQLYLPDGDGRPSPSELKEIWEGIEKSSLVGSNLQKNTKLRILPLKVENVITKAAVDLLVNLYDVEILKYTTEDELSEIIKQGRFDLKLSSNDFSSPELSENLKTTFNSSRPYVFLGKHREIKEYLDQAVGTENRELRTDLFKKIGKSLLLSGLIAPIAYLRVYFYKRQAIDISSWSTLYPEISMWKVRVND